MRREPNEGERFSPFSLSADHRSDSCVSLPSPAPLIPLSSTTPSPTRTDMCNPNSAITSGWRNPWPNVLDTLCEEIMRDNPATFLLSSDCSDENPTFTRRHRMRVSFRVCYRNCAKFFIWLLLNIIAEMLRRILKHHWKIHDVRFPRFNYEKCRHIGRDITSQLDNKNVSLYIFWFSLILNEKNPKIFRRVWYGLHI